MRGMGLSGSVRRGQGGGTALGIIGSVIHAVRGDETELVRAAVEWAARRVVRPTDSKTTARPASELAAAAGRTVTPAGIGGTEALRVFRDVLQPATRSQDDPMNLAYILSAPTRAAVALDLRYTRPGICRFQMRSRGTER